MSGTEAVMAVTDPEILEKMVREEPFWAIAEHADQLTDEQIMRCVEKEHDGAMMYAREYLKTEHLELCCQLNPKSSLSLANSRLTQKQLDYCCEKEPEAALRRATGWNPTIKLSPEQFDRCLRAVEPAVALECAPECLKDAFPEYAKAAPTAALRCAAHYLEKPMFEEFSLNDPATALEFANDLMDDELFKLCAEAQPWEAVEADAARVDDENLIRAVSGRATHLRKLLASCPSPSLALRLMGLHERLEPDVAAVVAQTIAAAI